MDDILKLAKDTILPAYAQPDGSPMPESVHLTTPTKSSHCCCTSHHQICQEDPKPRISHPNWASQGGYGHLVHITWTQEDETLGYGIDRQQNPTGDVLINNIVALVTSMSKEEVMDWKIE